MIHIVVVQWCELVVYHLLNVVVVVVVQGASDFKAMAAKLAQQKGNSVKKGWI